MVTTQQRIFPPNQRMVTKNLWIININQRMVTTNLRMVTKNKTMIITNQGMVINNQRRPPQSKGWSMKQRMVNGQHKTEEGHHKNGDTFHMGTVMFKHVNIQFCPFTDFTWPQSILVMCQDCNCNKTTQWNNISGSHWSYYIQYVFLLRPESIKTYILLWLRKSPHDIQDVQVVLVLNNK